MGKKVTHDDFVKKLELKHPNKFSCVGIYEATRIKMKFKCNKCEKDFEATPNNMLKEDYGGCPKCGSIKRNNSDYLKKLKNTIADVKNKIEELHPNKEYTLLASTYKNNKEPMSVKCNRCDLIFNISYVNICKGKGCRNCNQPSKHNSKGVKRIRKFLNDHNIKFEEEVTFDDCKHIKLLPFDFKIYLDNKFFLLEFDGEFHFRNYYKNEDVKIQQNRDNIKNNFCKENNIELLRINYKEYNKIENILESFFQSKVQRLSKGNRCETTETE